MGMQEQFIGLSAITAAAVIGLLWAEKTDNQPLRWLFKPVAAIAFVLAALAVGALANGVQSVDSCGARFFRNR